ncbi:unnamed protein product [Paramecium sonneborni]|uniref:TtsA-like Glycoside hydrolase family 108 domain-containing protein n=1 Tax=Paramecium sonneborni TaxID=65129 RepID=A0A8S1RIK9_9CILI|nr:unnamed protein product [Paramecium sonneborni]
MDPFDIILKYILEHEGGKVNDKNDLGGKTNQGITQNTYNDQIKEIRNMKIKPQYNPIEKDVYDLTDKEVKDFYYYQFTRCKANLIKDRNTSYVYFDSCINLGPSYAIPILQKACNLKADGYFGDNTLAAVNSLNQRDLQVKMLQYREEHYKKHPKYQFFKTGWNNRLNKIRQQTEKGIN